MTAAPFEGGCDVYIEKPVHDAQLLQVCQQLIDDRLEVERAATLDTLLDSVELTDALAKLESIVTEHAPAEPDPADIIIPKSIR